MAACFVLFSCTFRSLVGFNATEVFYLLVLFAFYFIVLCFIVFIHICSGSALVL